MSIAHRLSLLLLAALALGGAPAAAKDADYVGTWGKDLAQCKIGQEMENAPMIVKPRRYDRHETHCAFTSVRREGTTWRVKAQCSVEGDKQPFDFILSVAGDRLSMKAGNAKQIFQRCR